jgi:hypothetical protein
MGITQDDQDERDTIRSLDRADRRKRNRFIHDPECPDDDDDCEHDWKTRRTKEEYVFYCDRCGDEEQVPF